MTASAYYRLTIAPNLAAFSPEVDHVCTVLQESHGVVRTDTAAVWLHYGPDAPVGSIPLPAVLFPDCVLTTADGIHLDRAAVLARWPGLAPREDARQFDAIGLAFLLLSRIEERGSTTTDRYGRYRCEDDLQVQKGLYGRAPADEALLALARLITGRSTPSPATSYRVVVTHDVDRLKAYHRLAEPLRLAAGDLIKRHRPWQAVRRLRAYVSDEPWSSVESLLTLSERYGFHSRFYFMGPSDSSFDSPYVKTMPSLLHRLAEQILLRGHILGFHPCSGTDSNAALWQQQRQALEAVLGYPVFEGRQHGLLYHADITPDIWDDAGMTADYSLAYPERDGFRTGSTRLLPSYSLRRRRTLRLRQASTPIMEFGMFGGKYRDLSPEAAFESCYPLIETCRRHNGNLTILYHTGPQPATAQTFYEKILAAVA